jgi:hypothetical protein
VNPYKKVLFPIHIFQAHIKENELIKEELSHAIENYRDKGDSKVPEGWLTDNLLTSFDATNFNFKLFSESHVTQRLYEKYILKFFDRPTKVNVLEMWFNYYSNGEYQEVHTHVQPDIFGIRPHFSCIHYLKFDPEVHQPVVFNDPIGILRQTNSIELDSNNYNDEYEPQLREGSILMFPPYLEHYVPKSEPTPDNPRISVAFNIILTEYGEDKLYGP